MNGFLSNLMDEIESFGAVMAYVALLVVFFSSDIILAILFIAAPALMAYLTTKFPTKE